MTLLKQRVASKSVGGSLLFLVTVMAATLESVVLVYLRDLHESTLIHFDEPVQTWWGPVSLDCFTLDPHNRPKGFTVATAGQWEFMPVTCLSYQYNLRSLGRGRPKAYRVPFLECPEFANEAYTVSHLCHHAWCLNPQHHVLETLDDNKGRNGCPGGELCCHHVQCLIPGPNHAGKSSVRPSKQAAKLFRV